MTTIYDSAPIDTQPTSSPSAFDTKTTNYGTAIDGREVTIRNMVVEDSDFVGEMTTEAFRDKTVHLVGQNGMHLIPSAFDTKTTNYGTAIDGREVTISNMVVEDSDFVGEMTMEAFHDKMEHLVGPNGMPGFIKANQEYHRLLTDRYHRFFIAEVGGERAGFVQLSRREDRFKEPENFNWNDYVSRSTACRFMCLFCAEGCMKPKPMECYVAIIAVSPKFRGCGVGKALLDRAEQEGRALGCTGMSLDCTTTNRARNLYHRQGYVIARRIDGCCATSCSFGVRYFYRMEKPL